MCHARRHLALKRIPIISAHGVATLAAIVSPSTRIARFSFSCAVTSRLQNGGLRQRCISRLLVQAQQKKARPKRGQRDGPRRTAGPGSYQRLRSNKECRCRAKGCSSVQISEFATVPN